MTTSLFPFLFNPALQLSGLFAGGAKMAFFLTGTTTLTTVYDASGTSISQAPNGSGVVGVAADAFGHFPSVYLDDSITYRVRLYTALGAQIGNDIDPYQSVAGTFSTASGAALIGTSTGLTVQQELNAPSSLAADTGTTLVDHKYSGTGATKRTVAAIINDMGYNVFGFGAVGDGATNDLAAFNNCLAGCKATGAPMLIPGGHTYVLDGGGSPIVWSPTRTRDGALRSIPILGQGDGHTVLAVQNTGAAGIQIQSTTDWFDLLIENLTIKGAIAGPLLTIGKDDFSDPVNMMTLRNVSVENSLNNAANEAVRFNYITGGDIFNLRANSYANGSGTNVGSALRIRQAEFLTFIGGAAGNANRGIDITDGVNFGLTFIGQTYENTNYCFSHRSASSGQHSVLGGQFSNVGTYCFYSSAILSNSEIVAIGCNFQPGGDLIDPANYLGVRISTRRGITPPAVPASTVAATNTTGFASQVYLNGGNVTAFSIAGEAARAIATNAYIPEILLPGETIAITYTVAPTWAWKNIQI